MSTAILLTNYSEEDFTHKWDNVEYSFPVGASRYMEPHLAMHFARHLCIRELNKRNESTGKSMLDIEMKKALADTSIEGEDDTQLQQKVLDKNEKVKVAKKKAAKKVVKKEEESEEFADLKE